MYTVSGLGARCAYFDGVPTNPVAAHALDLNPTDNRPLMLNAMATAPDPVRLCTVLTSTPITHVLEQASNPLMPNLPCLHRLWMGSDGITAVWQVVHPKGVAGR